MGRLKRLPLRDKSNGITGKCLAHGLVTHPQQNYECSTRKSTRGFTTVSQLVTDSASPRSSTLTDSTQHSLEDLGPGYCNNISHDEVDRYLQSSEASTVAVPRQDKRNLPEISRWPLSPTSTQSRGSHDALAFRDFPDVNMESPSCDEGVPFPSSRVPPVACTLVAFEPGSLGLELEAIVDARGRRLGCRVFRVSANGQAARHGSIHPGDALVVLDGVDVLSEPFDDTTQKLLERQGQRRLIGFMGAAAVASASRTSDTHDNVTSSTRRRAQHSRRYAQRVLRADPSERGPGQLDDGAYSTSGRAKTGRDGGGLTVDQTTGSSEIARRRAREDACIAGPDAPHISEQFLNEPAPVRLPIAASNRELISSGSGGIIRSFRQCVSPEPRCAHVVSRGCSGLARSQDSANNWGSSKATGHRNREQTVGILEGEVRLCNPEKGIQENTALAAVERAGFLKKLQRTREATHETERTLAGQEVQIDVLKMEVKALEAELRRARQDLGASEASRREQSEAAKKDFARRDQDSAALSSQLRREKVARERDAKEAVTAAERAADKAASRAAATGRAAMAEAERRAEAAEMRAAEAEERRASTEAAGREASADAVAALRREREFREIEVREREKEISSLMSRVEAAEGRSRKTYEDKESQIRELEETAVKSVELAEQRRSEWEAKATAMSVKLREKEAKWTREGRRLKELQSQLWEAHGAQMKEAEERESTEIWRLQEALENSKITSREAKVQAQAEMAQLSGRVDEQRCKISNLLSQLQNAEQRARILETGAGAARKRAEVNAKREEELSARLASAETEHACQEVTVITLKTQLEELRRVAAAGEAALRENTRIRAILEKTAQATGTECMPHADDVAEGRLPLEQLANALRRRLEESHQVIEDLREELNTSRMEKEALRERGEDAAELRSLLRQKRGLSAELTRGAEAARARAECAEEEIERVRAEVSSLRVQLELTETRFQEHTITTERQLDKTVADRRAEAEANAIRIKNAENAAAMAQETLASIRDRQKPLEEAMASAEADRVDAVRRLTRKDGDLVAVQSRLESTLAELEAVKIALFEGPDHRVSKQRRACAFIATVADRHRVRLGTMASAFLRWRRCSFGQMHSAGQNFESLKTMRSTGSDMAGLRVDMQKCGARVLAGLLQKWVLRQSARSFWRIWTSAEMRTTGSRTTTLSSSPQGQVPTTSSSESRQSSSPSGEYGFGPTTPLPSTVISLQDGDGARSKNAGVDSPRGGERTRGRLERPMKQSPVPGSPTSPSARAGTSASLTLNCPHSSDLSMVSAVSSEPRYDCLRDDCLGLPWDETSRAEDDACVLDISDAPDWEKNGVVPMSLDSLKRGGDISTDNDCGETRPVAHEELGADSSWWSLSEDSSM